MKLEDLKCEFCGGSGEFSRDNSDGVAVEGECSFCEGTGIHENYRDFINTVERAAAIDANSVEERMSEASHYDYLDDRVKSLEDVLIPFNNLAIEVSKNRTLDGQEVLYAYNKSEIKLSDLSKVVSILNPQTKHP